MVPLHIPRLGLSKDVEKVRTDFEEKKQKHQAIIEVIRAKAEQKREERKIAQEKKEAEQAFEKSQEGKVRVEVQTQENEHQKDRN